MNEAHYLASLVHNLAVAARLEAAEVSLQESPVDLRELVARVVARHRPIAKQLEISLESAVPDEAVIVSADMTLLEQAVSNVTYNAVRYNRAGGHVAIVLEGTDAGGFSLRIVDDGPGIAEEQLSRLVERGYRGDAARTRAPDGQGLGLHIAFRAAELHGYTMTLKPSEAGGLKVVLESVKR
jgi:signal transduction histidine kinase